MAKSPAKRDDIFDLMAQSLSSEDVIDTVSQVMDMQIKYALQLTGMILDHAEDSMKPKEIFEIFDRSCQVVARNLGMDQDKD